jgi:hypothetical protein
LKDKSHDFLNAGKKERTKNCMEGKEIKMEKG